MTGAATLCACALALLSNSARAAQSAAAPELALDAKRAAEERGDASRARFLDACVELALTRSGLAEPKRSQAAAPQEESSTKLALGVNPLIVTSEIELTPAGLAMDAEYGYLVVTDGDTAAVRTIHPALVDIYHYAAGAWTSQAHFPHIGWIDYWDLEGDWLIGADSDAFVSNPSVYRRIGTTWQLFQFLPDPGADCGSSWFGWDIDIDGSRVAIGNGDSLCDYRESVTIFRYAPGLDEWRGEQTVVYDPPGPGGSHCGPVSALRGDGMIATSHTNVLGIDDLIEMQFDATLGKWVFQRVIASGLPRIVEIEWSAEDVVAAFTPGAHELYVFERFAGVWKLVDQVTVDPGVGGVFPCQVEVSASTIFVGERGCDDFGTDAGAVEVIARNGGWKSLGRFVASNTVAGDQFGYCVDTDESTSTTTPRVVVGAPRADRGATDTGAAYAFELAHRDAFVYCTAKLNSLGCVPRIGFSGTPSATSASPFVISARQILNNKLGVFYYGLAGRAATPFQGGVRCVAGTIKRTGQFSSGGNPPPNDCSGVNSIDFNARIQSGIDPNLVAGSQVNGQFWTRDGGVPSGTGLSDGIEFEIQP